ncbi:hypothetical protein HYW94_02850 [Candidatus Uhrbacteria bacterium]|nr:hypothetical protein [Candidatus Uhrbacteria bacterium]
MSGRGRPPRNNTRILAHPNKPGALLITENGEVLKELLGGIVMTILKDPVAAKNLFPLGIPKPQITRVKEGYDLTAKGVTVHIGCMFQAYCSIGYLIGDQTMTFEEGAWTIEEIRQLNLPIDEPWL